MLIPFRRLRADAKTPTRAHLWDAGFDLYAAATEKMRRNTHDRFDASVEKIIYYTGIAVSIPPGYVGLLFMRSSVRDTNLVLANAVGLIDPGYQGELMFTYRRLQGVQGRTYEIGDKVGQIAFFERPAVILEEVDEFVIESQRGTKGHGSSGT
jgi:dUTP pyrophosphatase